MKTILLLVLALSFSFSPLARAEGDSSLGITGRRAKVVGKAALYGAAGGLIVGVASQVFKKKAKNIFLFGSLGLYAGIVTGIYVISTHRGPAPYEGPDTYEDYGDFSSRLILPEASLAKREEAAPKDSFGLNVVNVSF